MKARQIDTMDKTNKHKHNCRCVDVTPNFEGMNGREIIAYYRVSTQKQGDSGLGLEAQRLAVHSAAEKHNARILAEYTEVESGRNNSRAQLNAAIKACKERGAILVIAKLDRLSRNAGFIYNLIDSDLEFYALDIPGLDRFTIKVLGLVAEREADLIRERTKAGLAVAKARGTKLGSPKGKALDPKATIHSVAARKEKANQWKEANTVTLALAKSLKEQGLSFAKIADNLNSAGARTPRGGTFSGTQVMRLLTN